MRLDLQPSRTDTDHQSGAAMRLLFLCPPIDSKPLLSWCLVRQIRLHLVGAPLGVMLCLCAASPAHACTSCAFALADWFLPPVSLWCLLALVGYLSAPVLCATRRIRLGGVPTLPQALLAVLCLLLAAALLGPIALLPLLIQPLILAARCCLLSKAVPSPSPLSPALRRLYKTLAAAMLILFCFSLYTRAKRTDGQFIVRWAGTGAAHNALEGLRQRETHSQDEYRYIVRHAQGSVAEQARERLALLSLNDDDKSR